MSSAIGQHFLVQGLKPQVLQRHTDLPNIFVKLPDGIQLLISSSVVCHCLAGDFEPLAELVMPGLHLAGDNENGRVHPDTYYALLSFRLPMFVSDFDPTGQGCVC